MSVPRRAMAFAILAGCVLGTSSAAVTPERREVARIKGPGSAVNVALAGPKILYSPILADRPAVYSVAGGRTVRIYEAPVEPLPKRFQRPSAYESRVSQSLNSLAGAPGVAAFVRSVSVTHLPKCRPTCGLPGYFTPLFSEVRARVGLGRFRRVAGGPGRCPAGQFWPENVAVTATYIVYSGRFGGCKGKRQESRVAELSAREGSATRTVVARFRRTGPVRVATKGRFVAWTRDWSHTARPDLHDDGVVVYDRARGEVAYEVELDRKPRITGIYSLAVQSDGKVAALLSREGGTCEIPQLVWSSPSSAPRVRIFPAQPASSSAIDLVGDRLMFVWSPRPGCSFSTSELVVEALDSSARQVLGRYDLRASPQIYLGPTFDFDGKTSGFSEGTVFRERDKTWTSIFVAPVG